MTADLVVRGIGRLLTMTGPGPVPLDGPGAVVVEGGRVVWVGAERDLPSGPDAPEVDAAGALVTPGFVDPHTHLLWAGDRRAELEARIAGEPYDGGGIATTRAATVAASDAQLQGTAPDPARPRCWPAARPPSRSSPGYGGRPQQSSGSCGCWPGCLRAHRPGSRSPTWCTCPPRTRRARAGFVADHVAAPWPRPPPEAPAWLDVFCDTGAFTVEEARTLLAAAATAGLGGRLHAEQLAGPAPRCSRPPGRLRERGPPRRGSTPRAPGRSPRPAPWPSCCPPRGSPRPARGPTSHCCATPAWSSRWAPTATRAPRGAPPRPWCCSTPASASGISVEEALGRPPRRRVGVAQARRGHAAVGAVGDLVVHGTDHEASWWPGWASTRPRPGGASGPSGGRGDLRAQPWSSLHSSSASSASTSTNSPSLPVGTAA